MDTFDVEPLLRAIMAVFVALTVFRLALNAGFGIKPEPVDEGDRV